MTGLRRRNLEDADLLHFALACLADPGIDPGPVEAPLDRLALDDPQRPG